MLTFPSRTKKWAGGLAVAAILVQMMTFVMSAHLNSELYRLPLAVRAGSIAPNYACLEDSDSCDQLNPDGSLADCRSDPAGYDSPRGYCQGFPLNHTCANQGECRNGRCSNGICVKTQVGQACKDDLGCSGSQICKSGKCFAPAAGSLYPEESCKVGSSCKSGKCVTELSSDSQGSGSVPSRPV
ncbi:hypothetical protein OC861_000776 [Tilletia horrida]|nr:hypothetical protein OC861_000776 [Tilletia horrida]